MFLWILATLAAFYVKGLCGFANTLVFASVMNFGDSAINISPVEVVLGFPTNLIMAWRGRRSLDARVFVPPSVMVLAGSVAGALLLKNADASAIRVFFGAVVVFTGLEMLFRERGVKRRKGSLALLTVIGVLSGLLCGLFGVGALLAAYVSRTTDTNGAFKANMCAVFVVENAFRIILYAALGIVTLSTLRQSLILMPFMLLALLLGMKSARVLNEKRARRLVILLLIVSGAALIIQNL